MSSPTKEPETFQHYQVMRRDDGTLWELGRGAMGVTYKAFDMNLRAPVALKVINALHLESETSRARFVREARAAAGLRHRNVASVYHLGHDDQSFFYAMEYVDGDTVEGLVKRQGVLPPAVALQIALQVSRALGAASKQQLVHRDIKPANLMVVTEDEDEDQMIVKVIDFGLARPAVGGEGSAHITMGGFVGTPQYASPEQLEEKELDTRSDIYSLGVTLWYMLVGKPPFSGTLGSVFIQQLTKPPPWDQLVGVSQPVRALLAHLLAKDPHDRPQSAVELRREIERCLKKLPSESGQISLPGTRSADTGTETPPTSAPTRGSSETESPSTSLPEDDAPEIITSALTAVPATGSILEGNYALEVQVGKGEDGRVFRARDMGRGGSTVAVKILNSNVSATPGETSRLEAVLEKLRVAPHPNLLNFEGLHQSGDVKFLVGEWVNGFNVGELLRARSKLTAQEVFPLLSQAAAAADHATDAGLASLGFSPHQILAHFPDIPEGDHAATTGSKTALNITVNHWPRFFLKFDALGLKREAGDHETLDRFGTAVPPGRAGRDRDTQTSIRGLVEDSHIYSLGALAYELFNGTPLPQHRPDQGRGTSYFALPALSEAANTVLRKALLPNPGFATSTEFFQNLRDANQAMPDADVARSPLMRTIIAPDDSDDSSETLIFDARAHTQSAPPAESGDSSAETLIADADHPLRHPTALRGHPETVAPHAPVTTARATEPGGASPVGAEEHPETRSAPPDTEEPDGSDARTIQGYSFVSRKDVEVQSPTTHDPVVGIGKSSDDADDSEDLSSAATIAGFSFKTQRDERADLIVPHPDLDIVKDDYGSEEVESHPPPASDLKTTPVEDILDVVSQPQPFPSYESHDATEIEAPTLEGYSFKSHQTVDADIPVTPPVDRADAESARSTDHGDPTVSGSVMLPVDNAATLPAEAPVSIVPSQIERSSEEGAPPATQAALEETYTPTLEGYSFKAHHPNIALPPPTDEADVTGSPVAEEQAGLDSATLAGYSFKSRSSDITLPKSDEVADEINTSDDAGEAISPREVEAVVEQVPVHPEPPTLNSPFIVVADAPVVDLPPPAEPVEPPRVTVPDSTVQPGLRLDQAEVSLDIPEPSHHTDAHDIGADKKDSGVAPALRPATVLPPEKARSTPVLSPTKSSLLVDKPLLEEPEVVTAKRPNIVLIGGLAGIVAVISLVAFFAFRGKHVEPIRAPIVTKPTPVPAETGLAVKVTPPPRPPVIAQPTASPAVVAVVVEPTRPPPPPAAPVSTESGEKPAGLQGALSGTVQTPAPTPEEDSSASARLAALRMGANGSNTEPTPRPATKPEAKVDDEKSNTSDVARRASQEAKRREPTPAPRPSSREPKPVAAPTPERAAARREPRPEPPKPIVIKKEAPKPTPEAERPRGPAVPFMR